MDKSKKNSINSKLSLSPSYDHYESNSMKAKPPYPKSVIFIIGNEFCERFSFYGMRTILVLYLMNRLNYSENQATMSFHMFAMACYFTPLIGAILADSFFGRYWTILIISCLYVTGSVVIAFASIQGSSLISLIGLSLIAFGTGGIKPCVSTFGGDQFHRGQEKQLQRFFSFFYIAINTGGLASTFLTPIIREDIGCFHRSDCYPLAFGIPAILMIISLSLFILGRFTTGYRIIPPQKKNIIVTVGHCVFKALVGKLSFSTPKKEHWLDHAENDFNAKTIHEVKTLMRILFLFIPLPIFWALFDQQSSRWTLQATKMNGNLGFYTIKPDQIQVINPLLIVLFIPIFDYLIYPIINKCGLRKPLRRMVVGGIIAGLSFMVCGFVEMGLESELPAPMTPNHNHIMIINAGNTNITLKNMTMMDIVMKSNSMKVLPNIPRKLCNLSMETLKNNKTNEIQLKDGHTLTIFFSGVQTPSIFLLENVLIKPKGSGAKIFTIFNLNNYYNGTKFSATDTNDKIWAKILNNGTIGRLNPFEIDVKGKPVYMSVENSTEKYDLGQGATYIQVLIGDIKTKVNFSLFKLVNENQHSVLLQLFQYILITAAEILFSVTGLEFSYSEAPKSMKSFIQSAWLLMVTLGNLLVAIIADSDLFEKQSYEFFSFGILMFIDIGIFAWIAYLYVPYKKNMDFYEHRISRLSMTSVEGELPKFPIDNDNEEEEKNEKEDPNDTYKE